MSALKLIVLAVVLQAVSSSNSGFILTAPKRLLAGSIESVCISLHNTVGPADISLDLLHATTDDQIATTQYKMTRDTECLELVVFPTPETSGRLKLQVKFEEMENYTINSIETIMIQQNPLVMLIQTDKPVYKPGQLVQFRLLTLTHDLKPVTQPLDKVWLESPSEVRLAQWLNLKTKHGLVHLNFQLSQEPIQGTWKIKVERNNSNVETKTFEVREYVLPRFEVTITPPDYILADSDNLTWKICAKYSYGQPVKGRVHIKANAKYSEWIPICNTPTTKAPLGQARWTPYSSRCSDPPMGVNLIVPLDGCFLFNVTGAELGLGQLSQHLDSLQAVDVRAVVTEANTDIERNATSTSSILHHALNLELLTHSARYFKPTLPYHGKLRALYPDSKPAPGKLIMVCVKARNETVYWSQDLLGCRNFTSDPHGFVHFTVPPQKHNATLFSLTATAVEYETQYYAPDMRWHVKMSQPTAYFDVQGWYSPSNSYIEISDDSLRSPRCNYHHVFRTQFTRQLNESSPTFHYLVKARGDLLLFGQVHPVAIPHQVKSNNVIPTNSSGGEDSPPQHSTDQFGIKLLITPKMSPVSQLMVYYVRDDGETVAATFTIHTKQCFANKVSAAWQQERQFPGAQTVLHLAAAPFSLCGISAVDKSTSFLAPTSTTNTDTVFNRLKNFHMDGDSAPRLSESWNYCEASADVDSKSVDEDLRRRRRSSMDPRFFMPSSSADASKAFDDFGVIIMTDLTLKTKPCIPPPVYDYMYHGVMLRSGSRAIGLAGPPGASASEFSVSAVYDAPPVPAMAKGGGYSPSLEQAAVEVRSFFPETWLWELVDTGSDGRAQVRRDLPHTVTDWIGGAVCISPQQGLGISSPTQITAFQPFFVELVLPYAVKRGEVVQIKVALYSFLSHSVPVRLTFEPSPGIELLSEESSTSQCVERNANWVHRYRIRATELGDVNLTVSAEVDASFPESCGPDTLISRRDVLVKPLLVKPEGFPIEITNSALICTKDEDSAEDKTVTWDLKLPGDVVDGSARAEVNMVADLMGPTLQNLGSLVQLPMGCGEQNMILFVPNLHVVNYLTATHQPNPVLQAEAIKNMEKGYQRELNYRHTDGSYSAFGNSDKEGSMWLTAFVVKTFAQARAHIFVDEKDLDISLKWISKHQLENGCFPVVGQVFHHDLRGGLSDDGMSAALTAFVLISLLETGLPLPPTLVDNAKYCLLGDNDNNVYTRALSTYALALLEDQEAAQAALNRLVSLATVKQEMMHWQKADSESRALSVEMTAYAILALVKVGGEENLVTAHKAVRWISQHRNGHGGFVSTQDTVVALEALSKYAASLPSEHTNLNILVTANAVENIYQITHQDRLLLKRQPLTELPTHIEVIAHGAGCALVQSWLRYNIHTATGDDALELDAKVTPVASVDGCSRQNLEFCIRYKPKDQTSNMAVLEVAMASGYVPDKESLSHLDNSIHVKRWEVQDDQVNFYFDSLSNKQLCVGFTVEQDTEVENPLPANARLYDYYQPELVISKSYQVATSCDSEPLPRPLPRNAEPLGDTVDLTGDSQAYDTVMVNTIERGPADTNNLIRVTKPRGYKKRRNKSSTENYPTPHPLPLPGSRSSFPIYPPPLFSEAVSVSSLPLPSLEETTAPVRVPILDNFDAIEGDTYLELITSSETAPAASFTRRFVDVDHDLEFPDGMEGPAPVYVPFNGDTDTPAPDNGKSCPLCWGDYHANFSSTYCNAAAVYKAIQRKPDTMRLLLDLTPSKNVLRLRKLVKVIMPSVCRCPPLKEVNATVLLVLQESLEGLNELTLDKSVNIWSTSVQQGQPEVVKLARSRC